MNGATKIALIAALTGMTAAPAMAGKGLGPLYAIKYNSDGIAKTLTSTDGTVAVDVEDIETINCGGCDTVLYGPGHIFHLRNLTKTPICAAMVFAWRGQGGAPIDYWGSGDAYYLKAGGQALKVGGIYEVNPGDENRVDLTYEYSIHSWAPIAKKQCGADPDA